MVVVESLGVINDQGGNSISFEKEDISPTLRSQTHGNLPIVCTAAHEKSNCLTPWDTQQARIFTGNGLAPTVAGADGGGGRNPAGLLFTEAGYIVRRLTPTEAERFMSLPDDWTLYGHDGKLMSDSARYQMCGNSIVVNVLAYIMQNLSAHLSESA